MIINIRKRKRTHLTVDLHKRLEIRSGHRIERIDRRKKKTARSCVKAKKKKNNNAKGNGRVVAGIMREMKKKTNLA